MNRVIRSLWLFSLLIIVATNTFAQTPASATDIQISRATQAPKIDGILTDQEWAQAAKITNFYQIAPGDSTVPSQPTIAYLMYDSDNLYLAFDCKVTNRQNIRAHLTRRDTIFEDDYVFIVLDTFNDQQRAFQFFFNPFGIQADAIISEATGVDLGFDTLLTSKGTLTPDGYTVEVAIPFRSLRFKEGGWGLHLGRRHQDRDEEDSWMPLVKGANSYLAQAGHLVGLTGISYKSAFEVIPTLSLTEVGSRINSDKFLNQPIDGRAGVSIKYQIKPNLTLDLAVKPDFNLTPFTTSSFAFIGSVNIIGAQPSSTSTSRRLSSQAISPPAQITDSLPILTFENRPFFAEGADIFRTPLNTFESTTIFSPIFAAKLTGKLGNYSLGLLTAVGAETSQQRITSDSDSDSDDDGDHSVIARPIVSSLFLKRDLWKGSHIGVNFSDTEFAGAFNRVASLDMRFLIGRNYLARFQFAESLTKDIDGNGSRGHASDLDFSYSSKRFNYGINYQDVTPGYFVESGFSRLAGRLISGRIGAALILHENSDARIRKLALNGNTSFRFDSTGQLQDKAIFVNSTVNFKYNSAVNFSTSYLRSDFGPLRLENKSVEMSSSTRFSKYISATSTVFYQQTDFSFQPSFSASNRLIYGSNISIKPNEQLNINFGISRSISTSAQFGDFRNTFYTAAVNQQFTRNIGLQARVNYDQTFRRSFSNLAFTYNPKASTFIFIGYNNELLFVGSGVSRLNQQFFIKVSQLLRF